MDEKDKGVRIFTQEERKAILAKAQSAKAFEESAPEMDDATTRYFQLKEIQLELDRALCEIVAQKLPLAGVWIKLRDWDSKELAISRHEEYASIVESVKDNMQKDICKLMQLMSYLGNEVDKAFKIVHPDSELEPKSEPDGTLGKTDASN